MIDVRDLKGICAMMPAFTTADGGSVNATATIDVDQLTAGVNRILGDGIDIIATTGSFGEFHTLLWEEHKTLIEATISVVRKRVPVFIGCTSFNTRETIRQIKFAEEAGADGVLCGVPSYYPSTVENAVQFYLDLAEAFPRIGIGIYHNPPLHKVTLPVEAFEKLITRRNIMFMKDSHRSPTEFIKLMNIVKGRISVFVLQTQMYPHAALGAAGCWSIYAWAGPSPLVHLRNASLAQDWEKVKQICVDISDAYKAPGRPGDLFWRENSHKLAINESGYCYTGPFRPPFRHVPTEIVEHSKKIALNWKKLCQKYPL